MASTFPRPASIFGRFLRLVAILSLGTVLLAGVTSETAATSLVAVQARGGPHGAIAALANNDEIVMSRSVGLMQGASADPGQTALGHEPVLASRSVGLMDGASADPQATALGQEPIVVSRSVGLMDGARS